LTKDFFALNQKLKYYFIIVIFILVDFSYLFWNGQLKVNSWYIPIVFFLQSIIFGGLEEIGWRYTFHPLLREKYSYLTTVIMTFISWGIWHCLFFYIDGSIGQIDFMGFYTGLLVNCFMLGMIYEITNSLWLCVFTHCLINTMIQTCSGSFLVVEYISKFIIIIASCFIVYWNNKQIKIRQDVKH
jgi:membrane protease YdiL (CAAX protease family)